MSLWICLSIRTLIPTSSNTVVFPARNNFLITIPRKCLTLHKLLVTKTISNKTEIALNSLLNITNVFLVTEACPLQFSLQKRNKVSKKCFFWGGLVEVDGGWIEIQFSYFFNVILGHVIIFRIKPVTSFFNTIRDTSILLF